LSNDASFIGNIPEHYDRGLGPVIFVDYAADIARRAAACSPARVLEIAAGTGIVTCRLRDLLPAGADLTATDLNPPMLEVARGRYLFNVWDAHRYNAFGRIAHEVAGSFFPVDPPQFYRVPFSYHQIDPIKESLIEAGFTAIDIAVLRLEKEIPDAACFAQGIVYGNPLIDQIRARGGVEPDRVVDAVAQALRVEFGTHPGRMTLQAMIFSASKR